MRRVRNSPWIRRLIAENNLSTNDLILPIFIRDGKNKVQAIKSMPGVNRYSVDKLNIIMKQVVKQKFLWSLFSLYQYKKKIQTGLKPLNKNNLVCKSIEFIKKRYSGIRCNV